MRWIQGGWIIISVLPILIVDGLYWVITKKSFAFSNWLMKRRGEKYD